MNASKGNKGFISGINGSLIDVKGLEDTIKLHDLIKIEQYNIVGEVIQIYSDYLVAQCYEETDELTLGQKVIGLYEPLSMELGPGLLGNIFDGIQRPLEEAFALFEEGFLKRGFDVKSLSREKKWDFKPISREGEHVNSGDIIGVLQETPLIEHRIMVPDNISGTISFIVNEGKYTVDQEIYKITQDGNEKSFSMIQKWPINKARPFKRRIKPDDPLVTGIRVIDLLFPVVKGGAVAVPGGFGTGKTVIQQSLAKWCNADVIIFVGCGERGNEIADVLKEFSKIKDPKSGRPLLERIVLIANTSNMPVSARGASIFSGVTIAEYYRDMGYDVAVLADSTSRWAEALREISGLLEEMPAEEGYPAYLPSKLSGFYERAGYVITKGKMTSGKEQDGSITIIGSVSPPSGDFSEPVTVTTKRFVKAFWALDASLAYSKHYPAINWLKSYSDYPDYIIDWWQDQDIDWSEIELDWNECRIRINEILSKENELKNITQLIGEENLPEHQQLIIFIANIIKESFLIQNAFDEVDNYTSPKKLLAHIKIILMLYQEAKNLISQNFIIDDIKDFEVIDDIMRIGQNIPNDDYERIGILKNQLLREIDSLKLTSGLLERK